jgi:hypothetical protein
MKLSELAPAYRAEAQILGDRIRRLEEELKATEDPEVRESLRRRILDLEPMRRQCRELAELTARYYERGYWRSEKYRV